MIEFKPDAWKTEEEIFPCISLRVAYDDSESNGPEELNHTVALEGTNGDIDLLLRFNPENIN